MPTKAPPLDIREFDQFLDEARARIPRYIPEWTDFNDSDPGMALVQLFAWLSEMLVYQMNQVPDRNYEAFLNLLNLAPKPASPATTHLTFTVKPHEELRQFEYRNQTVFDRSQVSGQHPTTGEPIVFETEGELQLTPLNLAAVQVNDGMTYVDYSELNQKSGREFFPFGQNPQTGSAMYLGFGPAEGDDLTKLLEDVETYPADLSRNEAADLRKLARDDFPDIVTLRVFLPDKAKSLQPESRMPLRTSFVDQPSESSSLIRDIRNLLSDHQLDWQQIVPDTWNKRRADIYQQLQEELKSRQTVAPESLVRLQWEYRSSKNPNTWNRLELIDDDTASFTTEGYIRFRGPKEIIPTLEGKLRDQFYYWIRCRVVKGRYTGFIPEIDFVRPNTVEAKNLVTVDAEVLGPSNGNPNQVIALEKTPVLPGSLKQLKISDPDNPDSDEVWTATDSLTGKKDEAVFVLDPTKGRITFGDGEQHGRIPLAGREIVASYRAGGGEQGNLIAGSLTSLVTGSNGVDSVTNEHGAKGGTRTESIQQLKRKAPEILRSQGRAVITDDFAAVARKVGGVANAKAIPLAHPDHPGVSVPGCVTVVVLPESDSLPPIPSQGLLSKVADQIDLVRLITTEVHVTAPIFLGIRVIATLRARSTAPFGELKKAVQRRLLELLTPSSPNGGRSIVEFGRDFHPTRLYGDIVGVDPRQIVAVDNLTIQVNGVTHWDNQKLIVPSNGLIYGEPNHEIHIESEDDQ